MARRANLGEVDLVDELGEWALGGGPLYRQLARAIAGAIERGVLERGTRLPPERLLASSLVVSRGTAVAAYDTLVGDGLVERRRGSGTYVVGPGTLALPPGREGSALVHRLVDRSAHPSRIVDLSISVLHDPTGLPPAAVSTRDLASVDPDTGLTPWGLTALRRRLAEHVTGWGLPTTADEIVVTTGAQQAIAASAACWLRPGDVVVVEDPTYPGAIAAFGQAGARLVGVPVDRGGIDVAALAEAVSARPALVYLQSTVHSPTGAVLSDSRRRAIADLLTAARVPLVEDLALADLAWAPTVPPPIAAYSPDASVAVIGSLSKVFWGGLRVGWVRAPAPLAVRFARVKATNDLGSSVVSQLMAERLLRSLRTPSSHLDALRAELRGRYDALASALAAAVPEWSWEEPHGGLSMWVRLPTDDADAFAQAALRHGVAVATAPALSPSTRHRDRIRLSFSGPVPELRKGADLLADAWRAHRR
jgi:DNA-binding transcriptional MocR family regulator